MDTSNWPPNPYLREFLKTDEGKRILAWMDSWSSQSSQDQQQSQSEQSE